MADELQIKHMVDQFLRWKLPEHFYPDCGISFDQSYRSEHGPVGTNLFTATQADLMVRHMLDGMPARPEAPPPEDLDGFEWMLVEIFGHRTHWGRGKEVDRYGAKMLRIDVPAVEWSQPTAEAPEPVPVVTGWVSHFYGGAAIFSHTLTDEATVLRKAAGYGRPSRYLPPPDHRDDDQRFDPSDDDDGA